MTIEINPLSYLEYATGTYLSNSNKIFIPLTVDISSNVTDSMEYSTGTYLSNSNKIFIPSTLDLTEFYSHIEYSSRIYISIPSPFFNVVGRSRILTPYALEPIIGDDSIEIKMRLDNISDIVNVEIYGSITSKINNESVISLGTNFTSNILGRVYNTNEALISYSITSNFTIFLNPNYGSPNGVISITSYNQFDNILENNIVIFNNIPGIVISSTVSELLVRIPEVAVTGTVKVYSGNRTSNSEQFTVLYDEEIFDVKKVDKIPTKSANYSRDLGINNFTEIIDENNIMQNVYNIILTKPGERLFNPYFGCGIYDKLFDIISNDSDMTLQVLDSIEESVKMFEPRATIVREESFVDLEMDRNELRIILSIMVPTGAVKDIAVKIGVKNG